MKNKRYLKIGIHCLLIFLVLIGIFRFFKIKYVNMAANSFIWENVTEDTEETGEYIFTPDSGQLSQTFICTTDILWGLQFQFEREQETPEGTISFKVEDSRGGVVYQESVPVSEIGAEVPYKVVFDHIEQDTREQVFKLSIQVTGIGENDALKILTNEGEGYQAGIMHDASGELNSNIRIGQIYGQCGYLNKLFWILTASITILIYALYYFLFIRRAKMEYLFLFTVLIIGFLYVFLMQPGGVPDETAHYRSAYAYSNIILQEGNGIGNPVVFREEDYYYWEGLKIAPDAFAYKELIKEFGKQASHTEMKVSDRYALHEAGFMFFGGAAGITLGRILGMNALTVFYLGRIFNLLLFCSMVFWAFKKLPFYKMSFFAICLLPMTSQLIGSYSYDSIIIGLSLMLIAAVLDYGYGKDSKAEIKKLIQIGILCALLASCKGGAYIPLCALILLIPSKLFSSKKNRRIFLGGTLLGMVFIYILSGIGRAKSTINLGEHLVYWNGEPGYNISWVFGHPGSFIQLLSNTIFREGEFYIFSLFGKDLGWFNYPIQGWIVLGFMIVFLISAVHVTEEKGAVIFSTPQKQGILLCMILNIGIIAAALMFAHTPMSSDYIQGIQGRYLIPLLFPAVLCMKNYTLTLRRFIDRELIFLLAWLQVLTIVSILATPLTKLMMQ